MALKEWIARKSGLSDVKKRMEVGQMEREAYWNERTKRENIQKLAQLQVQQEMKRRTREYQKPKVKQRLASSKRKQPVIKSQIGNMFGTTTKWDEIHDILGYRKEKKNKEKRFIVP